MRRAGVALLVAALPLGAGAEIPRPEPRPQILPSALERVRPPARPDALPAPRPVAAPARLRPEPRPAVRPTTPRAIPSSPRAATPPAQGGFADWVAAFRGRAVAAGVGAATLDRVLPGLRHLPDTVALDRRQSEFDTRIWDYLDGAVTVQRIQRGRELMARHAALLDRIEARFGVPPEIVVAVWGIETSYGAVRGRVPTLDTLATLARDGRRAAFFEGELIAALRIVAAGEITPDRMRGSWAGAMGHTQFMPSSYLAHAVDFTGNGRRDVWSDNPADALASAANYLAANGWQRGQPWGVEVALPADFDLRQTGTRRSVADWQAQGVRAVRGAALPRRGTAALMLPAGRRGPALLTFANFDVLKSYNVSDAYVIALGHLSDRLRGAGPFVAGWPRSDRALTLDQRREIQRRLTAMGFDTGGTTGRVGPMTRAAARDWQAQAGLVPDGYVSVDLLEALRRR